MDKFEPFPFHSLYFMNYIQIQIVLNFEFSTQYFEIDDNPLIYTNYLIMTFPLSVLLILKTILYVYRLLVLKKPMLNMRNDNDVRFD